MGDDFLMEISYTLEFSALIHLHIYIHTKSACGVLRHYCYYWQKKSERRGIINNLQFKCFRFKLLLIEKQELKEGYFQYADKFDQGTEKLP